MDYENTKIFRVVKSGKENREVGRKVKSEKDQHNSYTCEMNDGCCYQSLDCEDYNINITAALDRSQL